MLFQRGPFFSTAPQKTQELMNSREGTMMKRFRSKRSGEGEVLKKTGLNVIMLSKCNNPDNEAYITAFC